MFVLVIIVGTNLEVWLVWFLRNWILLEFCISFFYDKIFQIYYQHWVMTGAMIFCLFILLLFILFYSFKVALFGCSYLIYYVLFWNTVLILCDFNLSLNKNVIATYHYFPCSDVCKYEVHIIFSISISRFI